MWWSLDNIASYPTWRAVHDALFCPIDAGCVLSQQYLPGFNLLQGSGWRLGYEASPSSEDDFCATVSYYDSGRTAGGRFPSCVKVHPFCSITVPHFSWSHCFACNVSSLRRSVVIGGVWRSQRSNFMSSASSSRCAPECPHLQAPRSVLF